MLLRAYTGRHLPADLLAGLLVAALAVPQSLGYAAVAGVPVQVGLYTLPPSLLAYALFGSSRLLFVGPVSTVSVLSGSIVRGLSGGDPALAVQLTSALAIAAGLWLLVIGLFRAGWVAQFLSEPIVAGFVAGLVVLIVVGEIPGLSGLPSPNGSLPERLVALVRDIPLFHGLTAAVNPALAEAQQRAPVIVIANPANCSLQFDPVGEAEFSSSCDIAKSVVTSLGTGYQNQATDQAGDARVVVGDREITVPDGTSLSDQALAQLKADFRTKMQAALIAAGYPESANIEEINVPLVGLLVGLMVVFTVMFFAPMAAMAVELFPTRIRYSAMSLPYHIGSGWFGGFLPAIAFAMVAANGNIYFGLWYPFTIIVIGILVLAFLLPETHKYDLEDM